eukprot:5436755-Prymnesium_polylepis.2
MLSTQQVAPVRRWRAGRARRCAAECTWSESSGSAASAAGQAPTRLCTETLPFLAAACRPGGVVAATRAPDIGLPCSAAPRRATSRRNGSSRRTLRLSTSQGAAWR